MTHDLTIQCGADYQVDISYCEDDGSVVSMAGWSAASTLRQYPESRIGFPFTAICSNSGITLTMAHDVTSMLGFTQGGYDVFITSPLGEISELMRGRVNIIPRTTR